MPGGGLLKDPPKMIPVSEAIRLVESVLPSLGSTELAAWTAAAMPRTSKSGFAASAEAGGAA